MESQRLNKILNRIMLLAACITLALSPIFFLPITQDFYDVSKWMLLMVMTLFIFLLWVIQLFLTKKFVLTFSPVVVGFGSLSLAAGMSLLFSGGNAIEAIMMPIGISTFAAIAIIGLLTGHTWDHRLTRIFYWLLLSVTSILAIISIYQVFGTFRILFPTVGFLTNPLWTPSGSSLVTFVIIVTMLPFALIGTIEKIQTKNYGLTVVYAILTFIYTVSLIVIIVGLRPKIAQTMLPISEGWRIAFESMKQVRSALFGVGADNFITAFTRGRSPTLNTLPIWNIRFTTSATLSLHLLTTLGIIGGLSFFVLLRSLLVTIRSVDSYDSKAMLLAKRISLCIAILALLVGPPSILIFLMILAITYLWDMRQYIVTANIRSINARMTIVGILCIFIIILFYVVSRSYKAEFVYFQSLKALQRGDGLVAYNTNVQAISLSPSVTRYHTRLSQTSAALGLSIASRSGTLVGTDGVATISAQDRQTIEQLFRNAILEAQTATRLSPQSITVWENIAQIYHTLMGMIKGADERAITNYQRAITLDPTNPILRLLLGGIYMQRKDYRRAAEQFIISANLKPDYPTPYYNLARAYLLSRDLPNAIAALKSTRSLLSKENPSIATIDDEIAQLERQLENMKTNPSAIFPTPKENKKLSGFEQQPLQLTNPLDISPIDNASVPPQTATPSATQKSVQ